MSRGERESDESLSDTGDVALQDEEPVQVKEEEAEEQPAAKKRKMTTRGKKDDVKMEKKTRKQYEAKLGKAHVYTEGNNVYDVMLNQTNIQKNSNKFYQIQLLDEDSKSYSVWMRHGRVGDDGQYWCKDYGEQLQDAKKGFEEKFLDKTKNKWEDREDFKEKDRQYEMVLIDYNTNEKLDVKIQSLMRLICDPKSMEEMKKVPLGKLSPKQIDAGKEALKSIEECLKDADKLKKACSRFYTRIPHDFGMTRQDVPIISREDELKKKFALLEELRAIDEHPLDKLYHSLQCDLQLLDSSSNEYQVIEKYLKTSSNSTDMTVLDIFSVTKKGEIVNFLSQLDNRVLLWYGSHLSNWVGILREGPPVAPPEAPTAGFTVGEGVYFADMSSEAAKSCAKKNQEGLLLLCEVALGDCNKVTDPEARNLPEGQDSIKIPGCIEPDPNNSVTMGDGVIVLMGPGATREGHSPPDNRFTVYNPAQVRMRFLLRIRFNYS